MQILLLLMALNASLREDAEVATDWFVTVTENEVERVMQPVDPPPSIEGGSERWFPVTIDQNLAPGWSCRVLPITWRGSYRSRWLRCQQRDSGRSTVYVRTSCRSNRAGSQRQELWLGDKVSVELACRSGVSP